MRNRKKRFKLKRLRRLKQTPRRRFIYRRFRRVRNSNRVLDAWDYGYKAWKIPVRY